MVDVHQYPFVMPESMEWFIDYLRGNRYQSAYQAVAAGGWTAVTTANVFSGLKSTPDTFFVEYEDLAAGVG